MLEQNAKVFLCFREYNSKFLKLVDDYVSNLQSECEAGCPLGYICHKDTKKCQYSQTVNNVVPNKTITFAPANKTRRN